MKANTELALRRSTIRGQFYIHQNAMFCSLETADPYLLRFLIQTETDLLVGQVS